MPIWNWFKLKETGDLRYMLKLKDYEYLPNLKISKNKVRDYEKIVNSFGEIKLNIQYSYIKALHSYYSFSVLGKKNIEQQMHNDFGKYLNELDQNYKNYKFDNKTFKKSTDLYAYIKEKIKDYNIRNYQRLLIFDYSRINAEERIEFNLMRDIAHLNEFLNININTKTNTIAEYLEYSKLAHDKIQRQKNKELMNKK